MFGTGLGKQGDYLEYDIKNGAFKIWLTIEQTKRMKLDSREIKQWTWHLKTNKEAKLAKDRDIEFTVKPD